jgi:predicted MFS family arabinose efflux permease
MRGRSSAGVLRERPFRLVFSAQVVSLLGDGIVPVALAFAILDLTGSATDLGIVLAARTVPLVGCLLVGGVVADRFSRRRVMIAADLVRFASQGLLGVLLVSGEARLWQLAGLQVILGAASGFFNPASTGLIPMVAGARLQEANALRGIALAVGLIAGPVIAGILVATVGSGEALLADAGTYAVSAALLLRVHVAERPRSGKPASFLGELHDGWREFSSRTWVWTIVAACSLGNMFGAAYYVLGPVVAKQSLGGSGPWAAVLAAGGLGQVLGGVMVMRVRPRRPLRIAVAACVLPALPMLLLAAVAPVPAIALAALVGGSGSMVFNTLWETTLQQHVPPAALSRVSAYDWFGSLTFQPIGFALVGPIAAALGLTATLYAAAVADLVVIGSLLLVRDVRTLGPG